MKKSRRSFGTNFWSGLEVRDTLYALDTFFDFAHLEYNKQLLKEVVSYSYSGKICRQENPCEIFVFYTSICSFIKVAYCLQGKSKKWKVKAAAPLESQVHLASLSSEEYKNPFSVFQDAFAEMTPERYEFILCDIVQLALSPYAEQPDYDVITPYSHLVKMLDASQLIVERGIEKIRKEKKDL